MPVTDVLCWTKSKVVYYGKCDICNLVYIVSDPYYEGKTLPKDYVCPTCRKRDKIKLTVWD